MAVTHVSQAVRRPLLTAETRVTSSRSVTDEVALEDVLHLISSVSPLIIVQPLLHTGSSPHPTALEMHNSLDQAAHYSILGL
jgi:hypothetical protein